MENNNVFSTAFLSTSNIVHLVRHFGCMRCAMLSVKERRCFKCHIP